MAEAADASMKLPSSSSTSLDSGGSSQGTSGSLQQAAKSYEPQSRSIWIGRVAFFATLAAVAATLGYLAYYFLNQSEEQLAQQKFFSEADRALTLSLKIAKNKLFGAKTMARVCAHDKPNASEWPFVIIEGYYEIAESVVPTSIVGGLSMAPIVLPEQLSAWEDMAYDFYEKQFPNTTAGITEIGKGVWSKYENGTEYHDTTGETDYGSPYKFMVPKFQHSEGVHPLLMMNVHYKEPQGGSLDATIECSNARALSENPDDILCQSVSEMVPPVKDLDGPGAFVATPIYPDNDNTQLVGFIFAKINWNEVLENVFSDDLLGIDAVISTDKEVGTFRIVDGVAEYMGPGDLHDTSFDAYRVSQTLLDQASLSERSVSYTITLYPNQAFFDQYHTTNALVATIGVIVTLFVTSAIFLIYDFFVCKEFSAKRDLLTAKRQFVRFVSHEVRTPLNSVCMGLDLLKDEMVRKSGYESVEDMLMETDQDAEDSGDVEANATVEWLRLAHEISANAQSSVDVLNDLLNYDKIESNSLQLELTTIPIWNLVEATAREFKVAAAKKKIELQVQMPMKDSLSDKALALRDVQAVGDSVRLTQVLRNLVSNAVKFTPENGSLVVRASWKPSAGPAKKDSSFVLKSKEVLTCPEVGELLVQVQDSGAGMTKEQLKNLFGQGVQFNVNDLQAGQGSGLGLYIAKGIVEQHGGRLVADSEGLGKGTTFTMRIPLYHIPTIDTGDRMNCSNSVCSLVSSVAESPLKILVVDDSSSNRKLLSRLLRNAGFETDEASNGQEAVALVQKMEQERYPYDIVLLDYEMPILNGPSAAKLMRANGSDSFVIGVTGNVLSGDIEYFKSCGANAVLPKPFRMASLQDIIVEYNIVGRAGIDQAMQQV